MADTDRTIMKKQQAAVLGTTPAVSAIATVGQVHSQLFVSTAKSSDDGMASTTTSETDLHIFAIRQCTLKSITYIPETGTITADPTNNATITVSKRDSGGANLTTVGTLTTNAAGIGTTLAQRGNATFTLTVANVAIAAGSTFTFSIAKNGTGVVVRGGQIWLELEWT